jgi:hypothetical protein
MFKNFHRHPLMAMLNGIEPSKLATDDCARYASSPLHRRGKTGGSAKKRLAKRFARANGRRLRGGR